MSMYLDMSDSETARPVANPKTGRRMPASPSDDMNFERCEHRRRDRERRFTR